MELQHSGFSAAMPEASDEDCNRMGFAETGLGESWNCVAGAVTMWM